MTQICTDKKIVFKNLCRSEFSASSVFNLFFKIVRDEFSDIPCK
jgi:hypothetical protein